MIKVIVLCAMGMSSSLVVKAVRKAAEASGTELDIHCQSSISFMDKDYSDIDVVLLAPQAHGQGPEIREYLKNYNVVIDDINMLDYALGKGDNILKTILKLYESK